MIKIRILSLSLLLMVLGCKSKDGNKNLLASGSIFDKVQLVDLENKPFDLHRYKDKTIFLNFWATWCKPCIQEMPSIENAQDILKKEGVVFLFASSESPEEISLFRNTHNFKFNYVRVENSEELDIQGLPTTFIFDSK